MLVPLIISLLTVEVAAAVAVLVMEDKTIDWGPVEPAVAAMVELLAELQAALVIRVTQVVVAPGLVTAMALAVAVAVEQLAQDKGHN